VIKMKSEYKEQLLRIIQIQNDLLNDFDLLDSELKDGIINFGIYWADRLDNEHYSLTQLKSIANNILTFWKESIGIATEMFWTELEKNNIVFKRSDELNFVLQKGRFRRVDIGIFANRDWEVIKEFDSIKARFSNDQIVKISNIIDLDEKSRVEILKKRLKRKEIPITQLRNFIQAFTYISNLGLWDKHFTNKEVTELYAFWNIICASDR